MRHADGTLADLTLKLNEALVELSVPTSPADGTLANATAKLNGMIDWYVEIVIPHADGTLASAVDTYNEFVRQYILPGQNVNVYPKNWTDLGTTVPFPQWSVEVKMLWHDRFREWHDVTRTLTFPNVLSNIPLSRLREYMEEIVLRELRIKLGIDREEL